MSDIVEQINALLALHARDALVPKVPAMPIKILGNAADEIERLLRELAEARSEIEVWHKNSRETFEALVSMRNDINENAIDLPSLESDLLKGPEISVFCETVASAVVQEFAFARKELAEARDKALEAAAVAAEDERNLRRAKKFEAFFMGDHVEAGRQEDMASGAVLVASAIRALKETMP